MFELLILLRRGLLFELDSFFNAILIDVMSHSGEPKIALASALKTKDACLKGKYHENLMSFQNPKIICMITETKNNCLVVL